MDPCSPAAFEAKYADDPDPWRFGSSPDEQGRYDAIVDLLARDRYWRGYEPACSVGVLTVQLAARCDRLLAVDVAPTAVATAAARCRHLLHVQVEVGSVVDPDPGGFDLVVLSEVGYYFSRPALAAVIDRLRSSLSPGGELVACHWTGYSEDHVLPGAAVHDVIGAHDGLAPLGRADGDTYLLASWRRT